MLWFALAWALVWGVTMAPAGSPPLQIRVDLGITRQVMEGFGSSSRVWDDPHLAEASQTVVPDAARAQILGLLYRDLGLTRVRPVLDGGVEPVNDNADPRALDWGRFRFEGKRNDAHVEFVRQAREYGLRVYFPAPIALEPWMSEHAPEEYAEWVMAVLLRWRALGVEPSYYSLINEPAHPRSGRWSGRWMRAVIRSLGPQMRAAGLKTLLVIPDDLNPTEAYARAREVLEDTSARPYIGALAYHLYGGSTEDLGKMRDLGVRYRIPLWMTEYSEGRFADHAGALQWAILVHRLISEHGVSAVDYMWGFFGARPEERGHTLIAVDFVHGQYQSHTPTPVYYLMGQFSRFVRPGYARVTAASSDPHLLVTAYRGPRELVIVAINPLASSKSASITLTGGALSGPLRVVRTTRTERWTVGESVVMERTGSTTVFPGESVTTLVAPFP